MTVRGSQGAERVFGLERIIHSPLKRIGESQGLWWVVSWCLFHITRTARALGHDQRVSESIMGNCYCSGKSAGKRRGGYLRKREQEGLSAKVFWCLRSLSCHRSWGLERWCDNWGWPGQVYCSANEHPLSWVIISWNMMPKNSFA